MSVSKRACRVGVGGSETPWGNTTCCQQVTCTDPQHVLLSHVSEGTFTLMHQQRLCHLLLLFRASSSFTKKCNQLVTTMVRFKATLPVKTTTTMGYRGCAENTLINKTCSSIRRHILHKNGYKKHGLIAVLKCKAACSSGAINEVTVIIVKGEALQLQIAKQGSEFACWLQEAGM